MDKLGQALDQSIIEGRRVEEKVKCRCTRVVRPPVRYV